MIRTTLNHLSVLEAVLKFPARSHALVTPAEVELVSIGVCDLPATFLHHSRLSEQRLPFTASKNQMPVYIVGRYDVPLIEDIRLVGRCARMVVSEPGLCAS